ncbi:hypothetical protein D3C79_479800 [compost metagenome]
MPGVSMVCAAAWRTCSLAASMKRCNAGPWRAITRPGLVQNWPAPWVSEATKPCASASARVCRAVSNRNTGLIELISAYTGIGSGRAWAAWHSAMPPLREPVKPTALMRGSLTSAMPTSRPEPYNSENTPAGKPHCFTAFATAWPTSSLVPGWAPWALTTTGQPAARAEAVSPPATEKANGKLLAPNTATGPRATWRWRRSARGRGWRSGRALSTRTSSHSPARTTRAKVRSWVQVRPRSPWMRALGRPLSATARSIRASPSASICVAMVSRNCARCSSEVSR